jgi:hypothetical protein
MSTLVAQQPLDTLYANQRQVLSLFFESPIEKAITGAANYTFTFNRESPEPLGLLQASEGAESNILVLTKAGGIYSFIVAYRDSLSSFTRFIKASSGMQADTVTSSLRPDTIIHNSQRLEKICVQMLRVRLPLKMGKRQLGIRLNRSKPFYHDSKAYIAYEIENHSGIDYELESLSLLKVLGKSTRKSSYQQRHLLPVFSHQLPGIVPQGTTMRFVVVYPKFTLGKNESLSLVLTEKEGSRNFEF